MVKKEVLNQGECILRLQFLHYRHLSTRLRPTLLLLAAQVVFPCIGLQAQDITQDKPDDCIAPEPPSESEDFRFVPFISIPISYFIALRISLMRAATRRYAVIAFSCFVVLCALFFIRLFWLSDVLYPLNPNFPFTALATS